MIDVTKMSLREVAQGALSAARHRPGIVLIHVQPGLRLSRSDFSLSKHTTYQADSFPMAALSIMLSGHIAFDARGDDLLSPGDVLAVTSPETGLWTSHIHGSERVHNIEVDLTPEWFARQDPLLRDDASFDGLRRAIEQPLAFRRRPLHDRIRRVALEAFDGSRTGLAAALRVEARSLDLIVELAAPFGPSDATARVTRDRDRIFAVREEIERDPSRIRTLQELAARHGVSASKLKRDFFAVFGTCIGGFINERRMVFARQLLNEGMIVSQVAYRIGYTHPSNFSTAFRRRFGLSPREVPMRHSRSDA